MDVAQYFCKARFPNVNKMERVPCVPMDRLARTCASHKYRAEFYFWMGALAYSLTSRATTK